MRVYIGVMGEGLGFRVLGLRVLGFRVWVLGFRVTCNWLSPMLRVKRRLILCGLWMML